MPETATGDGTGHLSVLLARVSRRTNADLAALLSAFGATPDQWRILEVLSDSTGRPMGELAESCDLHAPTVTKACDRLIERGLIYRRQDDADRRRVLVHLSDDGHRLLADLRPQVQLQQRHLEARLGPNGATQLAHLLHELTTDPPRP